MRKLENINKIVDKIKPYINSVTFDPYLATAKINTTCITRLIAYYRYSDNIIETKPGNFITSENREITFGFKSEHHRLAYMLEKEKE
jgi:hypothetical protein